MRYANEISLKETVAALLLSCLIAGCFEMTSPGVYVNAEVGTMSINRTHKGDRLPQASMPHRYSKSSTSVENASVSPKRVPFGCDPAFSPFANPTRAGIIGRCMA
jgi:hypothetical protein